MKIIVARFIDNKHQHQQTGCHPERQTRNVDDGKASMLHKLPERDLEIIPEHDSPPFCGQDEVIVRYQQCTPQQPEKTFHTALVLCDVYVFDLKIPGDGEHLLIEGEMV